MEGPLRITVPNIEVKTDSNTGSIRNRAKQLQNNLTIFLELCNTMRIQETNSFHPGSENSDPLCFSLNQPLRRCLVFFNDGVSAGEILKFVLMIIAQVHRSIELFEIDEPVLNNFSPDQSRDRFVQFLLLHDVHNSINGFLSSEELSQLPHFVKMQIP
jgi:hypothetical protein